jgi:EcoRII C terminal/Restriction endonuclease EcoRII, N-terminal
VTDAGIDQWLGTVAARRLAWFAKRLSANDTAATGGHQAGFHLPNALAFRLYPELRHGANPRVELPIRTLSHGHEAPGAHLTYYNQRTRNECRVTGLGGRGGPLLDPDNTGALLIVAFDPVGHGAEAWVARTISDEQAAEAVIGEIEPGIARWRSIDDLGQLQVFEDSPAGRCGGAHDTLPGRWLTRFPTPGELSDEAIRRVPGRTGDLDALLIARHRCEYSLFRAVEEVHAAAGISAGFDSVGDFLATAQSVLQRRKSRAGLSLELQVAAILRAQRVPFERGAVIEGNHRPDFLFPSSDRYSEAPFGAEDVRMLAVKSTLRDRWRQVLREADKIPVKHLLTLDQGVSESHMHEITDAGVVLVIPRPMLRQYPLAARPLLTTFKEFVALVRPN